MSFEKVVAIADWAGPVGVQGVGAGGLHCFAPSILQQANRRGVRQGCSSFNGKECWKRWRQTAFSGSMTFTSEAVWIEVYGDGDVFINYFDGVQTEVEWSGTLIIGDDGDPTPASDAVWRRRTRGYGGYETKPDWYDWSEWEEFDLGCDADVSNGLFFDYGNYGTLSKEDTLLTRTWTGDSGSDSDTVGSWEWSYTGSLTATRSDEDTEAAMAARALTATDSIGGGYHAARPSDSVECHAVRLWLGMPAEWAPGQNWKIYYEVVRKRMGLSAVDDPDGYEGTPTPTTSSTATNTFTLTEEMFAPEDALGSMAEADSSWDDLSWEAYGSSATAGFAQRAWFRVMVPLEGTFTVRLKKVQTGEADSFVEVTTSASADGLNATAPVWVSIIDHTRTATVSVEWVRDAEGADVTGWVALRKVRTGAWGQRQWDHAATVAGSRFFKKQTAAWSASVTVSATLRDDACGTLGDVTETASLEKVWTFTNGWPSLWTLVSASGSHGTTSWTDETTGLGWEIVHQTTTTQGFVTGYSVTGGWSDSPPATSGFGWAVTATNATHTRTDAWSFAIVLRMIRARTNGEILSRELASVTTDETITVYGTGWWSGGRDCRVADVILGADAEGEMKEINVLWAEPAV